MRSRGDRTFLLWILGLAAVLLGTAVWRWFASGAPGGGDGFQYLSHALAMLDGRSYGDIGYLYTPLAWTVGPAVYPPGLPLTLIPLLGVFGVASEAPRVLMHVFLLAFVLLVGRYFAREGSREVAWGTAALVATAFLLADRANVVGSDLGLCAFAWGTILLADARGAWSVGRSTVVAVLGSAALLFRVAAAPLVPAGALLVLMRKDSRWRVAVPTVLWTGLFFFVSLRFGPGADPARTMAAGRGSGGSSGSSEGMGGASVEMLRWVIERLDTKILRYRLGLTEALLYPFPGDFPNDVYHVGGLLVACLGLWVWVRRRTFAFSTVFSAMTVLMLAVAPVWQSRYLWVLTPFVAYGFLSGVEILGTRLARRVSGRAPSTAADHDGRSGTGAGSGARADSRAGSRAVAIVTAAIVVLSVGTALATPRSVLPSERGAWTVVAQTLGELPDAPVRVASNRPRKVTWYTGVPAMPIVSRDLSLFLEEARRLGVTYVVVAATGPNDQPERFERWTRDHPGLFPLVAESGPARVFRIVDGR